MRGKIVLLLSTLFIVLMLGGCKSSEKGKTFSKIGLSVELDDSFIEKEVIQAPFYLESPDHLFMAIRETKTELRPYNITTLDSYIKAVLSTANKTATIQTFEEGDVMYKYAYYTSTVNDLTFGYMLLVMEGDQHFYSINFGCLEKNLKDNKDLYMKWAKTITVE